MGTMAAIAMPTPLGFFLVETTRALWILTQVAELDALFVLIDTRINIVLLILNSVTAQVLNCQETVKSYFQTNFLVNRGCDTSIESLLKIRNKTGLRQFATASGQERRKENHSFCATI